MKKTLNIFARMGLVIALFICGAVGHYSNALPDSYFVNNNGELNLSTRLDIDAVSSDNSIQISGLEDKSLSEKLTLKLFGLIPIKDVNVTEINAPILVPGGNPFGIKLLTEGVMVVGLGEIMSDGNVCKPAVSAGIKKGDVILSINDEGVGSNAEIENEISKSQGEPVVVNITRGGNSLSLSLQPVYSASEGCYKAGMWVRDSSAGIGTLTFYNPKTGDFGGLGHPVCDVDTGEIVPLLRGEVVNVNINGVNKSLAGKPGELRGSFTSLREIGKLYLNTSCGVFGELYSPPNTNSGIPMALKQEVQTGKATILTTVKGCTPKEYEINIDKIDYNSSTASKNMVITVTDEELLSVTGGIVQGMSGSPILQNGKIVGAVTHVFVNQPDKGYGIFVENMIKSAGDLQ